LTLDGSSFTSEETVTIVQVDGTLTFEKDDGD
jgi:hypothetical protein